MVEEPYVTSCKVEAISVHCSCQYTKYGCYLVIFETEAIGQQGQTTPVTTRALRRLFVSHPLLIILQGQPGPPSSLMKRTRRQTKRQEAAAAALAKAPSGASIASDSRPPTTGTGSASKKSSTIPGAAGLRNRLSGRLSRRESTDVGSVHSDKSAKEKDSLHRVLQQSQVGQASTKGEEDGSTKKRRKTAMTTESRRASTDIMSMDKSVAAVY